MTKNDYFEWLIEHVQNENDKSYAKLLRYLYNKEFRYTIFNDSNRAEDGIELRWLFYRQYGEVEESYFLDEPCSVLEMMIALAIRCEEIMENPDMGDCTALWFWEMIDNLGLRSMTDERFDKKRVDSVIERFLNRTYGKDGTGSLFIVKDCGRDLRNVEIWYQMCWYLDDILR